MTKFIYVFFITVFLCTSINIQSQNLSSKNKKAVKQYNLALENLRKIQINEAIESLTKAIDYDDKFIEAYLILGDIYHKSEFYEKESDILKKAIEIDESFFPITLLNIGEAEFYQENYEEALLWINRYKEKYESQKNINTINHWLKRVDFALYHQENSLNIELLSIGDSINSLYDEYWPSLTADEELIVFTVLEPRDKTLFFDKKLPKTASNYHEDFYFSKKVDGEWIKRQKLPGDINTQGNEGAQSLSADGNWMFFTACNREDGRGSCDIYFSQKNGDEWSTPINLGAPVNTPYWESQPSFSSDGKTLYFVSNRTGGVGGKDIWQATIQNFRSDGTPIFGILKCLSDKINTTKDENSPFIHQDNQTLYYSSNGKMGFGGFDIFKSVKDENGEWSEAENIGLPINTSNDEIGFVVNARGDRAYFSSDRAEDARDSKNIYWFDLPKIIQPNPVIYVKGTVYDSETNEKLNADLQLKNLSSLQSVVTAKGNVKTGEFLVCLPLGGKYSFFASHPEYLFYSGHFDIESNHPLDEPYYLDIALQPIKKGYKITLNNIFFELDSYNLKNESLVELEKLIEFMNFNKNVRIQIGGHTDNQGSAEYNKVLSENRAKEVQKYLVENGIDNSRMEYKGFGLTQPIDDNNTEKGRANNRRTEIVVL